METINYKSALEESSTSLTNVFVPTKVRKTTGEGIGLEYHPDVNNDTQLYNKIFETNAYHPDQQTLNEFYSTIFQIMNKKELGDIRNIGTVVGTAAMTVLGCLTFGTGAVGGIAGFIFGGTVGRCIANKLQLIRGKKNQKMTQEDLYLLKLKCLLEAANVNKSQNKKNINKHRLLVEKTIAESRVALESSVFKDQKAIKKTLADYRRYVMDSSVHKSVLLSYKLLKDSMRRKNMNVLENQKIASRHINEVLIPYVRLIELDENVLSTHTQTKNLTAYYKIKAFFNKDGIQDLTNGFSELQVTPEALESLKIFLNQEIQTKEVEDQKRSDNYVKYVTAEIELKKSSSGSSLSKDVSEKSRATPSPTSSPAGGRRKTAQPNYNPNQASLEEVPPNDEDVVEELHAHMTQDYFAQSQIRSKTALDASEANRNTGSLKPFSAALVNHSALANGEALPDMTRKANVESLDFYQANLNLDNQGSPAEALADMAKKTSVISSNIGLSKDTSQSNTPKPLLKLQSAYQPGPVTTDTLGKTPVNIPISRESNVNLDSGPLSKSPRKSSKSPLAKFFSKKKSWKETKTPRANSNSSSDKDSVNQMTPEKQVEQGQEEVLGNETEELLKKVNSVGNDNEMKWERVVNVPNITIEKIKPEDSPVVLLRCWATIQGFTPQEIFEQIYNTEKRAKWETVTMGLREVEKISDTQHYIYFYVKTPIGISERDFVQKRNYQFDYPEKGHITMSFKSTKHDNVPPVKGRVRGETYFAGYILRPSKKSSNSTDLCILSQVDIKGNIPKSIVNMVAGKAPAEWVNKLTKACEKARQEKK